VFGRLANLPRRGLGVVCMPSTVVRNLGCPGPSTARETCAVSPSSHVAVLHDGCMPAVDFGDAHRHRCPLPVHWRGKRRRRGRGLLSGTGQAGVDRYTRGFGVLTAPFGWSWPRHEKELLGSKNENRRCPCSIGRNIKRARFSDEPVASSRCPRRKTHQAATYENMSKSKAADGTTQDHRTRKLPSRGLKQFPLRLTAIPKHETRALTRR